MVPRPLSHSELLDQSELAGDAFVVDVRGDVVTLRFTSIVKGRVRGTGLAARLGWLRTASFIQAAESRGPGGEPILGAWSEDFRKGDRLRIYLCWRDGAYRTPAWNAAQLIR
jgi:hypothetical protein